MIVVGYFAWVKTMKGEAVPEKFHAWKVPAIMPETKKMYEDATIAGPFPLSQDEYDNWTLGQLAEKYPLPEGAT